MAESGAVHGGARGLSAHCWDPGGLVCRLQESSTYGTGFTMRFPRIEKVRDDKSWNQADTMATLREKVKEMQVESARGHAQKAPRKPRRTVVKVLPSMPVHARMLRCCIAGRQLFHQLACPSSLASIRKAPALQRQ